MSVQIDSIFTASARSTWEFLIEPGQGCYIPAYQRHYSWDSESIGRLFEDVINGVSLVLERDDAISFLGTIIAIHDSSLRTVQPIYRTEVASKVMTIIDGQQRICTIVMTNIALHDHIRRAMLKLKKQAKDEPFAWLVDFAEQILVDLESTILIDRQSGDPKYRYYPRVIRSISDAWSRKQNQAKYTSPIARLIWEYICLIKAEEPVKTQYKYDPRDAAGEKLEDHQGLVDGFKYVQNRLRNLSQPKSGKGELPALLELSQRDKFWESLFKYPLPDHVKKYIAEQQGDKFYEDVAALLRLSAFARYLNYRVALTIVTTSNEDDAFDMFEALNTTGEPLTAFETFKPKIIDTEGHENYEKSPSMGYVDEVESYLKRFRKADDRQRATTDMLIPFALAETGAKIQKKLTDQRRYLREEYENPAMDRDAKRDFVKSLAQLATFMRLGWDVDKGHPFKSVLVVDDPEAQVGFEALRDLKHTITVAPLVRFYQHALNASDDAEKKKRTDEFVEALKATVAFSMLWRGAMGGTENIDAQYRDIMKSGVTADKKQIPPLGRRVKGGALSLKNYKEMLVTLLGTKASVGTKEAWVKSASQVGIYEHSAVVARFLLFAACDDAMPDPKNPGLIIRGRAGVAPMLKPEVWENELYLSVEHIAPQSKSVGWDATIYEDAERQLVHRLGNLTLLPEKENGTVSNRPWEHKKLFYAMLCAETEDQLEQAKKAAKKEGLNLSKTAEEIVGNAKYLGLCKAQATCGDNWSKDLINQRSERLCQLAWDRLAPWLFETK